MDAPQEVLYAGWTVVTKKSPNFTRFWYMSENSTIILLIEYVWTVGSLIPDSEPIDDTIIMSLKRA